MRVDKEKLPYQIADFGGATFSALFLSVGFMASHASGDCSLNPYRFYYEFAFLIISLLSYWTISFWVWRFYRKLPNPIFSGWINWLLIAVIGLFAATTFAGIVESFECSKSLIESLGEKWLSAIRISIIFLPVMFISFIIGFVIETIFLFFNKNRKLR